MEKKLIQFRRELHQLAELSNKEYKTKEYLLKILKTCTCEIFELLDTGILAFFNFNKETSLAFRTEMDALPIQEKNQIDYNSNTDGIMHACGHDGHMAMMLMLAMNCSKMDTCKHNICLIFQPAEETDSGAQRIMEKHLLDRFAIQHIYALHLNPEIPFNKIAYKPGPMMAAGLEINIHIQGKGSHIAHREKGRDALACAISAMKEWLDIPQTNYLCHFGFLQAGTVRNSVAETALIQGSIRTVDMTVQQEILTKCNEIFRKHCNQTHCTFSITTSKGYPCLVNDSLPYFDDKIIRLDQSSWMCDDFAYYTEKIKGTYLFLGIGNSCDLHSCTFNFDEQVLKTGVDFYMRCIDLG